LAREHWAAHKDVDTALKKFPSQCTAEIAILKSFKSQKSFNYSNALAQVVISLFFKKKGIPFSNLFFLETIAK